MKDRISAVATALLISYLLVLQGLFGALASGAMAASSVDPLHVICTSAGTTELDDNGQGDLPQKKRAHDCPCASLCRVASGSTPALVEVHPGLPPVVPSGAYEIRAVLTEDQPPSRHGLISEARAPPTSL